MIDFHVHTFLDPIAAKAIPQIAKKAGGVTPVYSGAESDLKPALREFGMEKAVVLNIATNPHQQKKVNDFAISLVGDDMLIPFGSVHPDSPDALEELDRLKEAGIKGVKLHPEYQDFFVDEERMFPIYEHIAELGLITVFHAGVDIGFPRPVHCPPERLLRVLDCFGDTPVVAAHFGGWLLWDSVLEELCGTKVYLDTAFSYGRMPPDYAREIIRAHGADHVLLGSDMPWSSSADEARFIQSLGLPAGDEAKILSINAKRLLHI